MVRVEIINGHRLVLRPAAVRDSRGFACTYNEVVNEGDYLLGECFPMQEFWVENIVRSSVKNRTLLLIAELDGRIVGGCMLNPIGATGKTSHVCGFGVHLVKEARGLGIGSRILRYITDWAACNNYSKICLSVLSSNEGAIRLYRKEGFVEEGRRKRQYYIKGSYIDEVLMAKFV
ncbi:MAG: hypothetical protein HPY66_2288 [Firmicutes bacterium]|nr:hypothetical protein [Bacillota bacterium]MDI6706713.1 GNAT family N-acetyltransferase [Bacillota bacterium]